MPVPLPPPPPSLWHPHACRRLLIAGGLFFAVGVLLFTYAVPLREWVGQISPGCLFHRYTGIKCPGCGGTRALQALLGGDAAAALRFNFFWLPSALILGAELLRKLCSTPAFRCTTAFRLFYLPALKLYAASAVFWFIARNIFDW